MIHRWPVDLIPSLLSNIVNNYIAIIFKSDDSRKASDYRVILTLSVSNIVFKKLIHVRESEFRANKVISDTQFGFR